MGDSHSSSCPSGVYLGRVQPNGISRGACSSAPSETPPDRICTAHLILPLTPPPPLFFCFSVEGVQFIDAQRVVLTSDKSKANQPHNCMHKDQSISIMALPKY